MTHAEKVLAMRKHFASLGICPNAGVPRLWRMLWAMGLQVPPPVFMRFRSVAWIFASLFAVAWIVGMRFYFSMRMVSFSGLTIGVGISAGILFGLIMAWRCRAIARKYNLPLWADYRGQQLS